MCATGFWPTQVSFPKWRATTAARIRLWRYCSTHSVVAGRATAIAADLRSLHSLHSVALGAVGEITWFETACANNQSQESLLLSRLMNNDAKTCNIVVDSSTNSIKNTSCNSLDNILQSYNYLLFRKDSLSNMKWTRLCSLLQSIRVYKVHNSRLNDWF